MRSVVGVVGGRGRAATRRRPRVGPSVGSLRGGSVQVGEVQHEAVADVAACEPFQRLVDAGRGKRLDVRGDAVLRAEGEHSPLSPTTATRLPGPAPSARSGSPTVMPAQSSGAAPAGFSPGGSAWVNPSSTMYARE